MITEEQLRFEMCAGYDILSLPIEDRNYAIDIILKRYQDKVYSPGNIRKSYEIRMWKETEENFQKLRFYHAEDLLPYQSYLPQIFSRHKQYLSLELSEKVEMIETLFLDRFYLYVNHRAKMDLLRELGNLYCQKQGIEPCNIVEVPELLDDAIMQQCTIVWENNETISYIAVSQEAVNRAYMMGTKVLECIYHELDHFYIERKAFYGTSSKEEYMAYISTKVDQTPLVRDFFIGYLFLPAEYRAEVNSYQKVTQILKTNPYVNETDENWWRGCQYINAKRALESFNMDHQVYLTESQMVDFMGSVAVEIVEKKYGTDRFSSLDQEEREKHKEKAKRFQSLCGR